MDVIEYKLASNNPTLISHGICTLYDEVKEKLESGETKSKIPALTYLLTQCESKNGIVSKTACQAIVTLVQSGVLDFSYAISTLTACLMTAEHSGAVGSAICNLLSLELQMVDPEDEYVCPFNLRAPKHPLITVLEMKPEAWREVLHHICTMMTHCTEEWVPHHVTLLRPVFLYILCNPCPTVAESCRQTVWNFVTKSLGTVDLQIEILQWLRTKSYESCIDTNSRIIELAEIGESYDYRELCSALIPLIMSMSLELLRHGSDPRPNLDIVSSILDHLDPNAGSVVICFLSEMITISPSIYLYDIVTLASTVLQKTSWNRIVAHTLIASLVQWMAYPSVLSSAALDVANKLTNTILNSPPKTTETHKIYSNKPLNQLWRFDANIMFYTELCKCAEWWTPENMLPWLEKLSKVPTYVMTNYKLIVAAIFLESNDTAVVIKTCEMLVEIGKNGGRVLTTILYKLSNNTQDIDQTKALLFALPKLTGLKENIPIVTYTLNTLSAGEEPLNYLAIELYIQALAGEPRCHRYLHSALIELSKSDRSWQADITCARAMKYICEKHSQHGAELVPLLSQTMNRCSSNRIGGAASALVLQGISALCVAGVTEVCSTYRVLSPRLNKETRSIVLRALCEFFGDIPDCTLKKTEEYGKLEKEVLTKLWDYAYNYTDLDVNEAAFKALSAYKVESMSLSVLPLELRSHVEGPETNVKNDEADSTVPTLIPCAYWIALLKNIRPSALPHAGLFLQNLIEEELYSFRSGIYRWPHGEPVNFKYLPEKSVMKAVGEHVRRYKPPGNAEEHRIITECMRILAHEYPNALPPIQWKYLEDAIGISPQTEKYGILMACHQAQVSQTAQDFLDKHLILFTKKWGDTTNLPEECLEMYGKLGDICRAVGSNVLGPFLVATVDCIVEKANLNKGKSVEMFDTVMRGFKRGLQDEMIHNDNRSLLTDILDKLMDRLDVESKAFDSYINAAEELTTVCLERMTLPSVWLEVTDEKLRKAIRIRSDLVLKKKLKLPLDWLNGILIAAASSTAVQPYLMENLQRVLPQVRLEDSNAAWTMDLMRWIGTLVVDSKKSENVETASFLCEILFITTICLSATDCLVTNDELTKSHDLRAKLFPQALASIVQTAYWKDIVNQIMEWLNHMKTTAIPSKYKIVFHNAQVSLKNEDHFRVLWTRYLSTTAPINVR